MEKFQNSRFFQSTSGRSQTPLFAKAKLKSLWTCRGRRQITSIPSAPSVVFFVWAISQDIRGKISEVLCR